MVMDSPVLRGTVHFLHHARSPRGIEQTGRGMQDFSDDGVERGYRRARRRAWVSSVRGRLGRRLTELLSLPEVRSRIQVRGQRDLGYRVVPLDRIVGSEGRPGDFDRHFAPRRANTSQRWMRIRRAHLDERALPPVELIKVGEIYFVRDGHHRLSVARLVGQQEIEAHVVELASNVPLTADLDQRDLHRKQAQSTFVERSGIVRGDPGAEVPVEASEPATYAALMHHIDMHGHYMGREQGTSVSRQAAGVHWYQTLYRPVIDAIRRRGLRRASGRRTESDLYLSIMEHRHYMTEQTGHDPGPDTALIDYVERFGSRHVRRQLKRSRAAVAGSPAAAAGLAAADRGTSTLWAWLRLPFLLAHRLVARKRSA